MQSNSTQAKALSTAILGGTVSTEEEGTHAYELDLMSMCQNELAMSRYAQDEAERGMVLSAILFLYKLAPTEYEIPELCIPEELTGDLPDLRTISFKALANREAWTHVPSLATATAEHLRKVYAFCKGIDLVKEAVEWYTENKQPKRRAEMLKDHLGLKIH
jgi:hypothetical protein